MTLAELLELLKCGLTEKIDSKRNEIAQLIPSVAIMFDYDQKTVHINMICGLTVCIQ